METKVTLFLQTIFYNSIKLYLILVKDPQICLVQFIALCKTTQFILIRRNVNLKYFFFNWRSLTFIIFYHNIFVVDGMSIWININRF